MPPRSFKSRLDRFIHAPQTEIGLALLILLSVLLIVAGIVVEDPGPKYHLVRYLEELLTLVFIVELAIRYYIARNKQRFWRNYWLDIIAVIPFPPTLRILRLLRLLRLLRVGILVNRNLYRLSARSNVSLGAQLGLLSIVGLIVLVGALAIYLLEGNQNPAFNSLEDALWWSFFTLVSGEPIGGEPTTNAGRLVTLIVMIGGLTLFAVLTGVISAVMVQRLRNVIEAKYLELDELRKHIVICGWNRSGSLLIEELQADPAMRHRPIVVVAEFGETPERDLKRIDRSLIHFYVGDYTTIDVLENVGIYHASRAILLADATHPRSDQDRDARTVLAALTIEKLQPGIYTCAQLLDRKNSVQLRVAGVEDVIVADELASHLIATSARNKGSVDMMSELLTVQIGNQIYKISAPESWRGMTFWAASERLKDEFDAILVAVEQKVEGRRKTLVNPPKTEALKLGDNLIVIARSQPQLD
ncbi:MULTISPECIES: ion transporter [Trichocoleus]|uniref:BK channel n=1 Tax=Trichocoleus desertorum GB2-A4 TaxID=2933944 RepID=A0ABV0JDB3_9CYAN|nr:ion transporter [Trichocoleus sp. FACHB-46]MBD1864419.1 NAD-binding protein [Trichocoleus sp. FACHB-46]